MPHSYSIAPLQFQEPTRLHHGWTVTVHRSINCPKADMSSECDGVVHVQVFCETADELKVRRGTPPQRSTAHLILPHVHSEVPRNAVCAIERIGFSATWPQRRFWIGTKSNEDWIALHHGESSLSVVLLRVALSRHCVWRHRISGCPASTVSLACDIAQLIRPPHHISKKQVASDTGQPVWDETFELADLKPGATAPFIAALLTAFGGDGGMELDPDYGPLDGYFIVRSRC